MAPKRKGRSVKRDGTSLEVHMMKAEENAAKAEEERRKVLLEKQKAEERYTKLNMHKIDEQWRKLMRNEKLQQLKKEIEILAQQHEHAMDVRDGQLQALDKNIAESNEQYQMAVRAHNKHVDSIIAMYERAASQLERDFNSEVDALRKEFDQEKAEITTQHNKDVQEMNDIIAAMELEFEQAEAEARQEFLSKRSVIKNKDTEEYETLKQTQQQLIKDLENHFDEAHAAYLFHSREDTELCEAAMQADANATKTIDANQDRLDQLQVEVQHWRVKHQNNVTECEERNEALREEKNAVSRHFQSLKSKMNRMRAREEQRLLTLTKDSGGAMKKLEGALGQAERILKLSDMALKLESEREKILPFYESTVDEEAAAQERMEIAGAEETEIEAADVEALKLRAMAVDEQGRPIAEDQYLDNFYKRFNKVLLDRMVLERHRQALQRENDELRAILKQYLDGISVSEEVLANENPLLIVNQRTNVPLDEIARTRHHNTVNSKTGQGVYHIVEASVAVRTPGQIV